MCYCVHVDLFRTTTQYNLTGGERPFKSSLPHSSFIQKKWYRTILLSLVHVTRKDNFTMELIMLLSPELTMQHRNLKSWSPSHYYRIMLFRSGHFDPSTSIRLSGEDAKVKKRRCEGALAVSLRTSPSHSHLPKLINSDAGINDELVYFVTLVPGSSRYI